MNAEESKTEEFDVFLCHNSEDKPAVRDIAKRLVEAGIKPWLDEEQFRPGTTWQTALGQQIKSTKSVVVFVGASGVGPWQDEEIQAFLSQLKKRNCPVIPSVLTSAKTTPELPWPLANRHWVDFRVAEPDPIEQLVWGITGLKPSEQPHASPRDPSLRPEANDVQALVPPKEKVTIEIRLPGKNIDEFSAEERDSILAALYSLLKVGEIKVTQAVAGSIRLHLELTPEDADKIYGASQSGQLAALGISEARLYPAIALAPDKEQRSQLLILNDRVNETWVEGVLRNALHNEVLISLGKRPMDEAVEPPWKSVVEFSSQRTKMVLRDQNIGTIFDVTGLLLILGEPGSGKTTTLLELASNLLVRAKADPKERVPVVLNLSSWRNEQSLAEWIPRELSQKYQVPFKIAHLWLQKGYLVPLLDGLDELATAVQPDCVGAINDFIEEHDPSGLVVCCRLVEYQWLPKRLKLNGAVCLESLSPEEVNDYLTKAGSKLAVLRATVNADSVLQELAQTPLMLSIMSLAYEGASANELGRQKDSPEERRKQVFSLYVEHMFQRKRGASLCFPKEKIVRWLSWLAGKMRAHSQSVFLVEGLQPSWLGTRAQIGAYLAVETVIFGLVIGLVFGLVFGLAVELGQLVVWLNAALDFGLVFALVFGLVGFILGRRDGLTTDITLVEVISWNWSHFWKITIPRSIYALIGGLLIGGLVAGLRLPSLKFSFSDGLYAGLVLGVIGMLAVGLFSSLILGFTDTVKVGKASPNQGIKLSLKNSLSVFFVVLSLFLVIGVIVGMIAGVIGVWRGGLIVGGLAGLTGGLGRAGGSAVIKHYSLRLILLLSGDTPFNFIKFLDHCARLILLKKVGGGYIFIHRMLLEYFAELTPESKRLEVGSKASK